MPRKVRPIVWVERYNCYTGRIGTATVATFQWRGGLAPRGDGQAHGFGNIRSPLAPAMTIAGDPQFPDASGAQEAASRFVGRILERFFEPEAVAKPGSPENPSDFTGRALDQAERSSPYEPEQEPAEGWEG